MLVAALKDPRSPVLSTRLGAHRDGLVAEAIRQMARDLERHERARRPAREAAVRRAFVKLAARRDGVPTAREVAETAGVSVEDVLDERLGAARRPGERPAARRAPAQRAGQ